MAEHSETAEIDPEAVKKAYEQQDLFDWLNELMQRKDFDMAAGILATGLILQRVAIDELNEIMDAAEPPKPELALKRMEVVGKLYEMLRDRSYKPVLADDLITSLNTATPVASMFLKRKQRKLQFITKFGLNCEHDKIGHILRELDSIGQIVLFRGSDTAAWAAMALMSKIIAEQKIPILLLGGDDPFTRGLAMQDYPSVQISSQGGKWSGVAKENGFLNELLRQMGLAGVVVASSFMKFLNKDEDAAKQVYGKRLHKISDVFRRSQKSMMSFIPYDSKIQSDPEHGIHVFDVKQDMVVLTPDQEGAAGAAVIIDGQSVSVGD